MMTDLAQWFAGVSAGAWTGLFLLLAGMAALLRWLFSDEDFEEEWTDGDS